MFNTLKDGKVLVFNPYSSDFEMMKHDFITKDDIDPFNRIYYMSEQHPFDVMPMKTSLRYTNAEYSVSSLYVGCAFDGWWNDVRCF